jgi:hypothetical protein
MVNTIHPSEVGGVEERKCAVASCNSTNPQLYDEHFEHYYCDADCLAEYICENPEEVADWYAHINIQVIDEDVKSETKRNQTNGSDL